MILPWASGSHIFLSSSTVALLSQVFLGFTTTVRASNATGSSTYLMPASLQASISFFEIGREASEMSVSPRQNFLKPPPVPDTPTVTLVPFWAFWNSSATASVIGNTVLDPSTLMNLSAATAGADVLAMPPSTAVTVASAANVRLICMVCPPETGMFKKQEEGL